MCLEGLLSDFQIITYDGSDRNRIASHYAMRGGNYRCFTAKPHRGRRRLGYRGPSAAPPVDFCCVSDFSGGCGLFWKCAEILVGHSCFAFVPIFFRARETGGKKACAVRRLEGVDASLCLFVAESE